MQMACMEMAGQHPCHRTNTRGHTRLKGHRTKIEPTCLLALVCACVIPALCVPWVVEGMTRHDKALDDKAVHDKGMEWVP